MRSETRNVSGATPANCRLAVSELQQGSIGNQTQTASTPIPLQGPGTSSSATAAQRSLARPTRPAAGSCRSPVSEPLARPLSPRAAAPVSDGLSAARQGPRADFCSRPERPLTSLRRSRPGLQPLYARRFPQLVSAAGPKSAPRTAHRVQRCGKFQHAESPAGSRNWRPVQIVPLNRANSAGSQAAKSATPPHGRTPACNHDVDSWPKPLNQVANLPDSLQT